MTDEEKKMARKLLEEARNKHRNIDVSELVELTRSEDSEARSMSVEALLEVAFEYPQKVSSESATSRLLELVERGERGVRSDAVKALAEIVGQNPDLPISNQVKKKFIEKLDHEDMVFRRNLVDSLSEVSESDNAVPELVEVVDNNRGQNPEETRVRATATAVLAEIAQRNPGQAVESTSLMVELLQENGRQTSPDLKTQSNALSVIAGVAKEYTETVKGSTEELEMTDFLGVDYSETRNNAVRVIVELSREYPREIEVVHELTELLDDDYAEVRKNATRALGNIVEYTEYEEIEDKIEKLTRDSDPSVRREAVRVLSS